ncbi:MAG: AtpZ/AtpI family protein [Acidobacteriales bacterium]|jgi:F0F1-type ATP synthase assembly protein I|nr:AtpZ/AtpI family protein [Terriglobales bacterium]
MAGQLKSVGRLLGLAFVLPTNVVVGYGIGYLLDHIFSTHFLYIVFLLLGIAAGFVSLIREIQKGIRNDQG